MENKNQDVKKGCLLDSEQIKKILPHRYPFLLVDRILEMSDDRVVGIKNISVSEPFFQGHFPEKPVMPGVLMIEALAQTGGVMMLSRSENKGKLAFLVAVDGARFRRIVKPGDQLRLEVTVTKMKSRVGVVKGIALVDGEEACSADIMFTLGD